MRYVGEFVDINNEYLYKVEFQTQSGSGSQTIQLAGEDPVILKQNSDSLFDVIKTQSATIKIVTADYLYNLYNSGYNVSVIISRTSTTGQPSYTTIFYGYVTPNIYSQTYEYVDEIEVECISDVAMLKYRDYTTISNSGKLIYSMFDIVKKCLNNTRYTEFQFNSPFLYGFSRDAVGQSALVSNTIMDEIYLDEVNFFDDNEEQTPWTCYEVLEEIMRIMNLSLVENDGKVYLINYQSGLTGSSNTREWTIYRMSGTRSSGTSTNTNYEVIDEDSYFSSDNNVSLDETYRKIKVKVNTYPYDEVFNEILDPDNWTLSPKYETVGRLPQTNNMYVPYFSWKVDDDTMGHAYYLYYVSSHMTPYLYDVNGTNLTPNQTDPNGYLTAMIDSMQAQRQGRYRCGVGLMKIAQYNAEKYSVTSKLEWKPQIVLYTGVNNFNTADYPQTSGDPRKPTKKCQDAVLTYMTNNWGSYTSSNHWLPSKPMLKIESASPINVSADSYLIISGRIMVNDLEWEGSVKNEWNGCDQFEQPRCYKLYDQTIDFPSNRNWIGFPILQMQIRVGNKMLCSKPVMESGSQIGFEYTWMTESEYNSDTSGWSCIFDLPIGTDKWGFYKFYDITNTCDWRLGLDNGKGFAIPMMADQGLTGQMTVYIICPSFELYYLYVPDISRLPTTEKTYTVKRNPNNIWSNTGWVTSLFNVTVNYEGTMPSCIVIQDLKFDIEEVTYHTYSDTVLKKADNKKTDHEYENIININSVVDIDDIECKINTQDLEKCRSFSSMLYRYNNEWQYISTMTMDGGTNYRIQEDNIVQNYVNHYSSPKTIFDCDLKSTTYNPFYSFGSSVCNNPLMLSSQEKNLKMGNSKLHLVEI